MATTIKRDAFLARLIWDTRRRDQGQIVEISYPQIAGGAEGSEGPGEGLSLRFDHSDRSWEVSDTKLGVIMSGKENPVPTVEESIRRRAAMGPTR